MASAASQRLRRLGAHLRQHGGARPPAAAAAAAAEGNWAAVDVEHGEAATIGRLEGGANPLARLSRGDVPAVILRRAMPQAECAGLIRRFAERGMLPPAFVPFVAQDLSGCMAGFSGGSKWVGLEETGTDPEAAAAERLDIGTALGNLGGDQDAFFADAERSHEIYSSLFEGLPTQPIDLMYGALAALSGGRKAVRTASEPDGRRYCPTIYRSHLPEYGYAPHIDSVRHREVRTEYEVFRFDTQLGGILLLQAPERRALLGEGKTPGYVSTPTACRSHPSLARRAVVYDSDRCRPQTPPGDEYHDTIMYDAPCTRSDVAEYLADDGHSIPGGMVQTATFRDFAERAGLRAYNVDLQVGDMYVTAPLALDR